MRKITFLVLGVILSLHVLSQNYNTLHNLELKILKNQFDSSIVIANKILETDSVNWQVYYYLGKAYQAKYKYFDALKVLGVANKLDSANSVIESALAEVYVFIGKNEDAIDIYYNQYLRDTMVLKPIINLANTFRKIKEYGAAINYYQKAAAIDTGNFYYYKQQGYCASKINISLAAIYSYKIAIRLNPLDLGVYRQLANLYNSERLFADAIETCNNGLRNYPQDNHLMKIKAYANYLNRDFDSSIIGFNKLLELGDTSYFNLKYRGLAYFEKKEFEQADLDLRLAYEFNDKDAETCFFLGSALGRSGKSEEGIKFLYKAMNILNPEPNEISNIYSEMAHIYLNQEKYKLSLQYLKLAYKTDATPLLSFKMGQLYDYYLDNKKLAIDCYDGYLTMANIPDSTQGTSNLTESFIADSLVIENAKERIKILNEELFFERGKKK